MLPAYCVLPAHCIWKMPEQRICWPGTSHISYMRDKQPRQTRKTGIAR
jgi:hypothetical protein